MDLLNVLPTVPDGFGSAKNVFIGSWIVKFLTLVPRRLHCPNGFRFPGATLCSDGKFPSFSFDSIVNGLTESLPSLMTAPGKASLNCGFFT